MMRDAGTRYTLEFVRTALGARPRRLLEIGCGNGRLARALQDEGHSIFAVDSDSECVAAARELGVDAHIAEWPDVAAGTFDAVLFTRSLHHVADLEASLSAAFACLEPGGEVVIEDFDASYSHEPSFTWFAGLLEVMDAAGASVRAGTLLDQFLCAEPPYAPIWSADHHDHLHSAADIEQCLNSITWNVRADTSAYFFRYVLQAGIGGEALWSALLAHEIELVRSSAIAPLGRRYVAQAASEASSADRA